MDIISLSAGVGSTILGFKQAGLNITTAIEKDYINWITFEKNFPNVNLIKDEKEEILVQKKIIQGRRTLGVIGSIDYNHKMQYIQNFNFIKLTNPKFIFFELNKFKNKKTETQTNYEILKFLKKNNYIYSIKKINAKDYSVPQDRIKTYIIAYKNHLNLKFKFPEKHNKIITLKDTISEILYLAKSCNFDNVTTDDNNNNNIHTYNNEYSQLSVVYRTKNTVRSWNEPSYTIQPANSKIPLHPNAPKLIKIHKNYWVMKPDDKHLYRKLSVRECARIQTFPDDFRFYYRFVNDGYKMVGNSIPIKLVYILAKIIYNDLKSVNVI